MNAFRRDGRGHVPPLQSLVKDAVKDLGESVVDLGLQAHEKMKNRLDFTVEGKSPQQVRDFLVELLSLEGAKEPVVQSGGIYGVSNSFHDINGALIVHEVTSSPMFSGLSKEDQARCKEIYEAVFLNPDLRNRNPLHPGVIDSCIIGNVLNYPKHIFGMPCACFATDGNEALSCCLFSYRQEHRKADPAVLIVGDLGDISADVKSCVERLRMEVKTIGDGELGKVDQLERLVAVVTNFESTSLGATAAWAHRHNVGLHLHVSDAQWRRIFTESNSPVHFDLPQGVRSMSLEDGILRGAYTLYRDHALRDYHVDVPYQWQTVYLSPNEGGSAAGRPLFMDFCLFQLGWKTIGDVARSAPVVDRESYVWAPSPLKPTAPAVDKPVPYEKVIAWAKSCAASRQDLEMEFISFQQEFMGGKKRQLEGMTTAGGTRSINLAFEAVIRRDAAHQAKRPLKVLTGNPHLAVERAARRFLFDVVRVEKDGTLEVEQLKKAIADPDVAAVYAQTLSYTDGITDPLSEILSVMEEENKKESRKELPVVLLNDSCLAFNVLVHNDGNAPNSQSYRLLDMTDGCVTPTIVMNDAHKHIGTDKGLSTMIGTNGILSYLKGNRKVSFQPQVPDLVRALASVKLVGREGYEKLYSGFNEAIEKLVRDLEAAGMKIIHKQHRVKGSTVIAVEDPSGAVAKKLKKKGYSTAPIYEVAPHDPSRCQTGWQLSLTPHQLRKVESGKPALEAFGQDAIEIHNKVQRNTALNWTWKLFRENSLIAYLVSGNVDPFLFQLLCKEGVGRNFAQAIIRRVLTAQLDSGTVCSLKRRAPLKELMTKIGIQSLLFFLIGLFLRRRFRARSAMITAIARR